MRRIFLLLPALALAATGCLRAGADASALEVSGTEYSFKAETKPLSPGLATIRFRNDGAEPHQAQIAKLNSGVTTDAVTKALQSDTGDFFGMVTFVGGSAGTAPKATTLTQARLGPGGYLLVCFLPTPDGKAAHFQKGMIGAFTVAKGKTKAAVPASSGTVRVRDHAIDLPAGMTGKGTLALQNDGKQPHEIEIVKLAPGGSLQDVFDGFEGKASASAKYAWAGGIAAVGAGETAWFRLELAPGRYLAFCLVPDPDKGAPHAALGMTKEFTIS